MALDPVAAQVSTRSGKGCRDPQIRAYLTQRLQELNADRAQSHGDGRIEYIAKMLKE